MDWISSLLLATVRLAIPLLLISLAELYGQRAGMVNIGLEGLAAIGALVGFLDLPRLPPGLPGRGGDLRPDARDIFFNGHGVPLFLIHAKSGGFVRRFLEGRIMR